MVPAKRRDDEGPRYQEARARMLSAGFDEWVDFRPARPITPYEALPVRDIVGRADRKNGALYNLWAGGVGAYKQDLLLWTLQPERLAAFVEFVALMNSTAEEIAAGGNAVARVRELAVTDYSRNVRDPASRALTMAQFAAVSLVDHNPEAAPALRSFYGAIGLELRSGLRRIFRAWGRRLRPPWTERTMAVVLSALADGMILRGMFDEETATDELFADAVVALLSAITTDAPAPEGFDEWARAQLPALDQLEPGADARSAIVSAALAVYTQGGWESVTTAAVASRAGVSRRKVQSTFPPAPYGLAVPIWSRLLYVPLQEAADLAQETEFDPLKRLVWTIRRLADTAARHRPLTLAHLHVVQQETAGTINLPVSARWTVPLPALLVGDLLDAYAKNILSTSFFSDEEQVVDFAAFMIHVTLTRLLTRPEHPPAAVAEYSVRTLFPAIVADLSAMEIALAARPMES